MRSKKPKADAVHLVRTLRDPGRRLDVEPTMKTITVDGIKYGRSDCCWIHYDDGKIGAIYTARVSAAEFLEKQP